MANYCSVGGYESSSVNSTFSFYVFPVHKFCPSAHVAKQRQSDKTGWKLKPNLRVCSRHFIDGRPELANPDSTLHLAADPTVIQPTPRARLGSMTHRRKLISVNFCDNDLPIMARVSLSFHKTLKFH